MNYKNSIIMDTNVQQKSENALTDAEIYLLSKCIRSVFDSKDSHHEQNLDLISISRKLELPCFEDMVSDIKIGL